MKITSEIAPSPLMKKAMDAMLAGASMARAAQLEGLHPAQKSKDPDDLVTEGDEKAQEAILNLLPRSFSWRGRQETVGILAEEKHTESTSPTRLRWVIDPIDGTLPYSRGEASWCVSIALQELEGDWVSRLGVVYQASPDDLPGRLCGRVFSAENDSAHIHDLKTGMQEALSRPPSIISEAELGASGTFGVWAREEFSRRHIAVRFRRSICHAVTELLLGKACAVVQDAGPLEWDIAAIQPIARLAGAHVHARQMDYVGNCPRYAAIFAWDEALFHLFCEQLPAAG